MDEEVADFGRRGAHGLWKLRGCDVLRGSVEGCCAPGRRQMLWSLLCSIGRTRRAYTAEKAELVVSAARAELLTLKVQKEKRALRYANRRRKRTLDEDPAVLLWTERVRWLGRLRSCLV